MYQYGLGCHMGIAGRGRGRVGFADPFEGMFATGENREQPGEGWYPGPDSPPADSGAGGTETESPAAVESPSEATPGPTLAVMPANMTWSVIGALAGFALGKGKKKLMFAAIGGLAGYLSNRFTAA